jgi:flagellar secretion chaperone FliS
MAPMLTQTHSQMRAIAGLYQSVKLDTGVAGASPHRLVEMLFEEFLASCSRARGALRAADVAEKGRAIARAVRIIDEGLRAGLNMKDGGALARELHDLYGYITVRMTHANLHNDEPAIAECAALVQPLYEAWRSIGPLVAEAAAAH